MKRRMTATVLLLCLAFIRITAYSDETNGGDEYWDSVLEQLIAKINADASCVSAALYFPDNGEEYYFNAEKWYMHASLYKLPLCMMIENMALNNDSEAERLDKKMGLEASVEACLVHSNNDVAKILLKYYAGVENFYDYTSQISGCEIAAQHRSCQEFNAALMLEVLKELYSNEAEYPNVVDYMKQAQENQYLRTYELPGNPEVAQKYGSWESYKHIAGIIYADRPVLVVVMTKGLGVAAANNLMGELAAVLCDYCM